MASRLEQQPKWAQVDARPEPQLQLRSVTSLISGETQVNTAT